MRARPLLALLVLAGCGGGDAESPLNDAELKAAIENLSEAPPERPDEPPEPALVAIAREDLERELGSGAGCDFSAEGRLLFASVSREGFSRVNGRPVEFTASGDPGPTGGFFTSPRFTISVGRLTHAGVAVGEATTWPARLVLTERGRDEGGEVRIDGAWRCGA